MPRMKGETTKLVAAKTQSDSIRTTVPSFIVKTLHLTTNDMLTWDFDPEKREVLIVRVIRGELEKVKEE